MDSPPYVHFGGCLCGGFYEVGTVEVRATVGGRQEVLPDVARGLCSKCGARVYKVSTLEFIEAALMRPAAGSPTRSTPAA